jgi:hypothetical protein
VKRLLPVLLAALALAGCTSSGDPGPTAPASTHTLTQTSTRTAPPPVVTFKPPAPATVRPLPPGQNAPKGEKDKRCPYIKTGLNQDDNSGVNLADIEGDRVYRTTVLTKYRPVGCRFYFYAPPSEATADIRPYTFATATEAYNAMVLVARTGTTPIPEREFVKGATGVAYRTKFFGQDGARDWAFVFAKGKHMVIIHTQRKDTSRNAVYLGKAIAEKF